MLLCIIANSLKKIKVLYNFTLQYNAIIDIMFGILIKSKNRYYMSNIIEIKNLKKYYGDVKAVDDISFNVVKGSLFAFLGLNGAGKSTTINILVGVQKKDSGECFVDGKPIEELSKILPEIGIVFQSSLLDKKLTVYDNLFYRAMLYDISKEEFEKTLKIFIDKLKLGDILKKPLEKLSGGQKRKVDIARALIHKPKILILDEPTTGLDPKTRKLVWDFITELIKENDLTVMLTTHYMEEASIADYVVIIDSGKIVAEGTPNSLKNNYANDYLKAYKYDEKIIDKLENKNITYSKSKECLEIKFKDTNSAKEFLVKNSDKIFDMEIVKGSMDDVFLAVTGKNLKENI